MRMFHPERDPARPEDVRAFVDSIVELWDNAIAGRSEAERMLKEQARTAGGRLLLFFGEQQLEKMMGETREPEKWNLYCTLRPLFFRLSRMLPDK